MAAAVEGEEGVVFRSSRPVGQEKFDEVRLRTRYYLFMFVQFDE